MKISVTEDEAYPVFCYSEDPEYGVEVPDKLIKDLEHAREVQREAVHAIARWIKFTSPEHALDIQGIIEQLPSTDEWKAGRKKR